MKHQYTNHQPAPSHHAGFEGRLRESLRRKINEGREGMDLNGYKGGKFPQHIVNREFSMSEDVIELGCEVNRKNPNLEHYVWLAWMTNTFVEQRPSGVRVHCRSQFFADGGEKHLGKMLKAHFGLPVTWIVDHSIRGQVER